MVFVSDGGGVYMGPAENVSVVLAIFKKISSARSWRVKGTSHQPAFMGSCLTIVTCVCPVYLVDELVLVFYVPF